MYNVVAQGEALIITVNGNSCGYDVDIIGCISTSDSRINFKKVNNVT